MDQLVKGLQTLTSEIELRRSRNPGLETQGYVSVGRITNVSLLDTVTDGYVNALWSSFHTLQSIERFVRKGGRNTMTTEYRYSAKLLASDQTSETVEDLTSELLCDIYPSAAEMIKKKWGPNLFKFEFFNVADDLTFQYGIIDHCDQLINPKRWTVELFNKIHDGRYNAQLIEIGVMIDPKLKVAPIRSDLVQEMSDNAKWFANTYLADHVERLVEQFGHGLDSEDSFETLSLSLKWLKRDFTKKSVLLEYSLDYSQTESIVPSFTGRFALIEMTPAEYAQDQTLTVALKTPWKQITTFECDPVALSNSAVPLKLVYHRRESGKLDWTVTWAYSESSFRSILGSTFRAQEAVLFAFEWALINGGGGLSKCSNTNFVLPNGTPRLIQPLDVTGKIHKPTEGYGYCWYQPLSGTQLLLHQQTFDESHPCCAAGVQCLSRREWWAQEEDPRYWRDIYVCAGTSGRKIVDETMGRELIDSINDIIKNKVNLQTGYVMNTRKGEAFKVILTDPKTGEKKATIGLAIASHNSISNRQEILLKIVDELNQLMFDIYSDVMMPRFIRFFKGDLPSEADFCNYGVRTDFFSPIVDRDIMVYHSTLMRYVPLNENPHWMDELGPEKCDIIHNCPCSVDHHATSPPKVWFHSECLRGLQGVATVPEKHKLMVKCLFCDDVLKTTTLTADANFINGPWKGTRPVNFKRFGEPTIADNESWDNFARYRTRPAAPEIQAEAQAKAQAKAQSQTLGKDKEEANEEAEDEANEDEDEANEEDRGPIKIAQASPAFLVTADSLATVDSAEPMVEEPSAPVAPIEEPSAPVAPIEEPTLPMEEPSAPVAPVEEPSAPVEELTLPVEEPTLPMEEPSAPVEEPTLPVEEPTLPMEEPSAPVEEPTLPMEEPSAPARELSAAGLLTLTFDEPMFNLDDFPLPVENSKGKMVIFVSNRRYREGDNSAEYEVELEDQTRIWLPFEQVPSDLVADFEEANMLAIIQPTMDRATNEIWVRIQWSDAVQVTNHRSWLRLRDIFSAHAQKMVEKAFIDYPSYQRFLPLKNFKYSNNIDPRRPERLVPDHFNIKK
jgi:hypothetical protein